MMSKKFSDTVRHFVIQRNFGKKGGREEERKEKKEKTVGATKWDFLKIEKIKAKANKKQHSEPFVVASTEIQTILT